MMKRAPIFLSSGYLSLTAILAPSLLLTRPQLLTRIEPIGMGRDISSTDHCDSTSRGTAKRVRGWPIIQRTPSLSRWEIGVNPAGQLDASDSLPLTIGEAALVSGHTLPQHCQLIAKPSSYMCALTRRRKSCLKSRDSIGSRPRESICPP
jgi:hypothetical protein